MQTQDNILGDLYGTFYDKVKGWRKNPSTAEMLAAQLMKAHATQCKVIYRKY